MLNNRIVVNRKLVRFLFFLRSEDKILLENIGLWRFFLKTPYYIKRKYFRFFWLILKPKKWSNALFWDSKHKSNLVGKWFYGSCHEIKNETQNKKLLELARQYQKKVFYVNGKLISIDENPCFGRWDVDPITGKQWPLTTPYHNINYSAGDVRYVWEIGRLHHLVTFAQAWRLSQDVKWCQLIIEHVNSFFSLVPFGYGIQWRDGLQLAIRLFNLIAIADLCHNVSDELTRILNNLVVAHVNMLLKQLSPLCELQNNHSIGEACGLMLGGIYLDKLALGQKALSKGMRILKRELKRQIYSDGMPYEGSVPYARFDLDFLVLTIKAMHSIKMNVPAWLVETSSQIAKAISEIIDFKSGLPPLGDGDDGRVLRFDDETYLEVKESLILAEGVLNIDLNLPNCCAEGLALWVNGEYKHVEKNTVTDQVKMKCLSDSGLVHFQHDKLDLWVDCGPTGLGIGGPGGHGHNDTTAIILHYDGKSILNDPGWFSYFCDKETRDYFRSTEAHNTLMIDHEEQATLLGRYLIKNECRPTKPILKRLSNGLCVLRCGHTGYDRLNKGIKFRRTIALSKKIDKYILYVVDRVVAKEKISVSGHLGSQYLFEKLQGNKYAINDCATLEFSGDKVKVKEGACEYSKENNVKLQGGAVDWKIVDNKDGRYVLRWRLIVNR